MKSKLNLFLVFAALITSVASQAYFRPGWERPILKASLIELDQTGHEINIGLDKILTMTKQDGARVVTGFKLVEEVKVMCIKAPCPPIKRTILFDRVKAVKDSCGSIRYTAKQVLPMTQPLTYGEIALEVHDHTNRICEDYRKYMWDVKLTIPAGNATQTRRLYGNPKGVITPQ
jgi:hypothetical protein